MSRFNLAQRIVVVVALGVAVLAFGSWVTRLGRHASGWVAYTPLSNSATVPDLGGLHSWVRLVIWLVLICAWAALSVGLLRTRRPRSD